MSSETSLGALFASAFLSATILPGGSEVVLAGVLHLRPDLLFPALVVATLGNTLGGMSTYLLARLIPRKELPARIRMAQRHGSPILVLSWVPIIGDALCAAAGVLRLNWHACLLWMALGKGLRYVAIAAAMS
ncbi:DedA family protein [Azoarcus sp. L1K30]|uniref:YqaA family protein n=1 Tax=Azoarcus sp. L1K30 TaxID=2820277 RepID=UPI001B82C1B4|nr:VTT domain-containing protein [Azoarcus sp. L1K30]MBR0566467.1 DedA family protein [Azoarcus sp. L1K30]